jgi:hypothetical protein
LSAYASAAPGLTIVSVQFQYSPAGAGTWTTFPGFASTTSPNQWSLDTAMPANGLYDFRVVATDSANQTSASAVVPDLSVANSATYVALDSSGSPLAGTLTLTAIPEQGGNVPNTVTFESCPTSKDCPTTGSWKTLATVGPQLDNFGSPTGNYVTTLDTTTLPDGSYDLGVSAEDCSTQAQPPPCAGGDAFQGGAVSLIEVDNTAPTVTLDNPGPSLSGVVPLSASPQDAGSGVASVKFEVSPAGADSWTTVGVATTAPYSTSFDTRQFANGSYDLRAEATDKAGNKAASPTLAGVAVANSATQQFDNLTLTNYAPPATKITLLGELPGSEHETWALGQTNAPPPTVDGQPLPYTAQGAGQLVVLKYTDDTGWQIVDVLRSNADGNPAYPIFPGGTITVRGQMTASGEAWIALFDLPTTGPPKTAMFHRSPGGRFLLDGTATTTVQKMLGALSTGTLSLEQTSTGTVYGLLTSPNAPRTGVSIATPTGSRTVNVGEYAELVPGAEWSLNHVAPPTGYPAPSGISSIVLAAAQVTGDGTGWAALEQDVNGGGARLTLAKFDASGSWTFLPGTGLDALDGTGEFDPGSHESVADGDTVGLTPLGISVDSGGVWVSASTRGGAPPNLIARYDATTGRVVDSWCAALPRTSFDCANPLDSDHPAAVPTAAFDTSQGVVGEALSSTSDQVSVYAHGTFGSVAAPGYSRSNSASGQSVFVDPTDGWIVGANTLGRISATPPPSPLTPWPLAARDPLLSAALTPGQSTTDTAGALAVGLAGTALHYDPAAGWVVDATPRKAQHVELTGVAFAGPSQAVAVGQDGTILDWNGSSWSEDPQSVSLTTHTLNAIAFGSDGQGWAVGGFGTILHYDGTTWSAEQIDAPDAGSNVTSVAVAGQDVFAVAGGNLIMRSPDGTWHQANSMLPSSPAPATRSVRLVSGLPDGGLAVAGFNYLIVRQSATAPLAYAPQSFQGIPVALAAFRDPGGDLRAFISVAPSVTVGGNDLGGLPPGDGDLLLQSAGGWADLSHDLPAGPVSSADGVVQPDPVLAIAASPDGAHAWAVGGYSGTHAADGIGTDQLLSARSQAWFTAAIWRYDAGGSAAAPTLAPAQPSLPASPNTVSFAYFSSGVCHFQCASVQDAQPTVNDSVAASEIAAYAQQPGGPAFAMLGGNAVGPDNSEAAAAGNGALDLAHLPQVLSPLSGFPLYAAYGPFDAIPTSSEAALPWAQAFAGAPAPFGSGAAPSGITPMGSGDPTGPVHKYYAFQVSQNGGTLVAIVLDNSGGSLEASAPGQTAWLTNELAQAHTAGLPVVVFAAQPLSSNTVSDANDLASQLASAGVLAIFTTSLTLQDQVAMVPANAPQGAPQIPEYEGATMTYQQPSNGGVLWYDVSVDTNADTVSVNGVPVVSSLALDPVDGLSAARSSTLRFQAIGRRPAGTIATTPLDPSVPGFDQYVEIPSSTCATCIGPSYSFKSSNPKVGNFVVASSPGSPFPKLTGSGATTPSSKSGLFCAFNGGTTTVTVTAGLLSSSLPVTVQDGGYGPPCGTVAGGPIISTVTVPGKTSTTQSPASNPTPPPNVSPNVTTRLPVHISFPSHPPAPVVTPAPVHVPVKAPTPAPTPVPGPVFPPTIVPAAGAGLAAVVVPPPIPPITPVPPGGATVSAQATAKREEKQRQHASQSAYVIRPAGASATDWFYPVVAVATVLSLLLVGTGLRPPRARPGYAVAEVRDPRPRGPRRR